MTCSGQWPVVFTDDTVKSMYMVLFWLAVASFLLCIAVAAGMSSHLSKPIRVLNGAMDEVRKGKLETRVHTGRIDEFGELADNFNVMTENLGDYMEKQVEQQRQLNQVQIAMMQAQLNPHFLYNTLDTMKWVAKANHIPDIATLAAKLAKILRTSISSAQFISLKEEMDLVECYAEIQRFRFNGKFRFEYDLPKDLEEIWVPRLIVQPIVENAVIHGLADSEDGHILVHACEKDGLLIIEVSDDGCGISQEVIDHLNSRDMEKMKGHIGFYNVDSIIRFHYGPEYGLTVCRMEEGGTVKYIPFASRSALNSMLQISNEIEEAAIIQDIPWIKRMFRIIIPIQKSAIISGYMLPFMTCLRELSLFLLLCTQGFILSTTLDYFDEMGLYAFSSAINLILIVTILIFNTLVNKLTGASLDEGIGGS